MTRRTRLEVSPLEDRVTPVLGPFDTPFSVDIDDKIVNAAGSTEDYSGVVFYGAAGGTGTGFLLDRGAFVEGSRHIVTAAHVDPAVGDQITFFRRLPDGNLDRVTIPVIDVWVHPAWTGNVADNVGDVAVATLAAVAPFGVNDYAIYTAAQASGQTEVGQVFLMGGYGLSGTGFVAQSNNQELQRMTVTATGGQYQIVIPARPARTAPTPQLAQPQVVTAPLQWNATAAQIQAALAAVGVPAQVVLENIGPNAPAAPVRNFEVLFTDAGTLNRPRLTFQSVAADPLINGGNFGSVGFKTLLNGGTNPEFQRVTVNATGGRFVLGFSGIATTPIDYSPGDLPGTAARIQAALQALNASGTGPGEVTVRAVTSGQDAGTFEVSFDDVGFDVPLMTVDATQLLGTARVATIIDGGNRPLRTGTNVTDAIVQGVLRSDFGSARPDQFGGQGDSGGAGFIALPDGTVAAISVVSYATVPSTFGALGFNTRLSKYNADILAEAGKAGYPLTLDMQYQFAGDDGSPDTITVTQANLGGTQYIQLWVEEVGKAKQLYYQDAAALIDSVRLIGTSDAETFVIDPNVSKVVSVNGGFGNDTLIGPGATTAWRLTAANQGTGDTPGTDFNFQGVENLVGKSGNDTFAFDAAGSLSGKLDGGGGADVLDFSAKSGVTVQFTAAGTVDGFAGTTAPVAGGFDNLNGFTGNPFNPNDVMATPDVPGRFTHTGAGGTFTNLATGQSLTYLNVDTLVGGAAADVFNVTAVTAPLVINGGAGDDTVTVAADAPTAGADRGPLTGSLTVAGGDGVDVFRLNGTAADEAVTVRVSGPGQGDVLGATPSPAITVGFSGLEQFLFDGRGGNNTFTALDTSGAALGTPTDPGSGVVAGPTGPTGANARMNGVTVGGTALSAFTVNGDPDGSGDRDVLVVVGTSAAGLQSPFGEAVVGDGRDVITISETQVTFRTAAGSTTLLPVQIGYANGVQTFNTLYVAGGNERGNEGDTINVPTSLTFNVVADGMLPSGSARPGDRVVVSAPGGADAQLVSDPSLGPTQVRVTARADLSSAGLIGFESGAPPVPGVGLIAVGTDAGFPSTIRVFDRTSGAFRYEVAPFEPGYTAGVKVAAGDVNGDGVAELVVGAGPGGGPRVAVFDGLTGNRLFDDFFAYEDTFRGGVTVAVGDINQDGFGDLILGTGVGGGPRVRVLSGRDLTPLRDTLVFEASFRGGVSVSAGDVNGDGVPDLISSTGAGGGPRVVVLDGRTTAVLSSFFVFDPNSRTGFFAAGGDVNGDGFADIIAGSGAGAAAQVRVFSGFNRAVIADFAVNDPFTPGAGTAITAGVRVAVADADGDGVGDIVTGLGPGGDAVVRTYKVTGVNPETNALFPTLQEIRRQDAFDAGFGFGIFVGASD